MGTPLKNYSGSEVSCNFGALSLDTGLGEDDYIKITQQNDGFTFKGGLDGSGTRSKNKNRYTVVEVSLMQSSDKNIQLSLIHEADMKAAGGSGIAPLSVVDRQGTSKFAAAEAWIIGPPEKVFGREAELCVWRFGCHDPVRADGGN